MKKRILSMLIVVCMVFAMFPSTAFATGDIAIGTNDVDNLVVCENHKEHESGKDGCGYIAAVEGTPCAHLNEDGSFSCTTEEDEDEATSSDAEYVCWHDDDCGFIEAAEGRSCKHECELCSTQAVPPVEDDSTLPPVNAPSEEQTRNETPCKDEAEGLDYLDEIAPEGTELTAEKQAFLDAHLAICEVCDTIMNPPLMNLASVIDVADITALNNALKTDADTEIRLTASFTGEAEIPEGNTSDYTIDLNGFTLTVTTDNTAVAIAHNGTGTLTIKDDSASGMIDVPAGSSARGIDNNKTGTVVISGGTFKSDGGNTVRNVGAGEIKVTGGTVQNTGSGSALANSGRGTVNVSGGTVQAVTGSAIISENTGAINISGNAVVTSANQTRDGGTIVIAKGTADDTALTVKENATVKNTSTATGNLECNTIYNGGVGTIDVSGGTVSAVSDMGMAIYNKSTGLVKVSGNALITSKSNDSLGTIVLAGGTASDEVLQITGGTVEITDNGAGNADFAIRNDATGIVNVSGGTVQATGSCIAISNNGTLNVSGAGTQITAVSNATIENQKIINVSGGMISSTNNIAITEVLSGTGTTNVTGAAIIKGGTKAMAAAPTLTGGVTAKASTSYDGSALGAYDPANIATYKYIEFAVGAPAHTHCVCGGNISVGDHTSHTAVDYTAFTGNGGALATGNYYLTGDVTLTSGVTIASNQTVNLCLNGKKLDGNGGAFSVIMVLGGGTLNLCDCSGTDTGQITGGNGNYNNYNNSYTGGGINTSGTLNLYGGNITKNGTGTDPTAQSKGGGVYNNKTFTMYGGKITNNTATSIDGTGGGGVASYNTISTFTMHDGSITGNTAANTGGGVDNSGTFTMNGGSITGNTATGAAGGVYSDTFNLGGDVIISGNTVRGAANNVFLDGGKTIEITSALTGNSTVGVTMSSHTGTFTSGTAVTNSDYAGKFTSDEGYTVAVNGNQLELKEPAEPTPSATFTATGADSGTLSGLVAAAKYQYSLDGGTGWKTITGTTTSAINSGITTANGIQVVRKGNGTTTVDSAVQTIAVTQAAAPTGVGKTDETLAGSGGTITGVAASMEYKLSTASTYTAITGASVTGLAPGTYHVREKASGIVLASPDVSVTIAPAVVANKVSNITKGTNHPTITAAIAAANSGDTLQLLENIAEQVIIASGDSKSYTLDLNGKTLEGVGSSSAITHNGTGTLTIKDSGSDGKVKGSSTTTIGNTGTGTVTVSGGTVENTGTGHAICNYVTGTVNISGGTVQSIIDFAILNSNGTVNVSGGMIFSTDSIAISGGTVNVTGNAIVKGGGVAMNKVPTLTGVTAKASTNYDGSSLGAYDPANIADYKYIEFAVGVPTAPGTIVLNGTVSGVVGTQLPANTTITATLSGDTFVKAALENTPITTMFKNIPAGITATASNVTDTYALVTFTGTPTAAASGKVTAYVPAKVGNIAILNSGIDIPEANISGGSWSITNGGSVTPPSPPSGGGGGGSSSNTTPPATKPTEPVSGNTENTATVDDKGNANVTLTDKNIQDAIADANAEAAKKGVTAGDITAVIHVTTGGMDAITVTVNLPKTTQEQVIGGKIAKVELVIDRPDLTIGMNLAAITEINKQANADVQITATKTDASKRSEEANNAIGSRPAYDLKATYGGDGKSVTNFGTGMVSIEIPYKLQDGEAAGGVAAVYVDGAGKITYLQSSGYDAKRETLVFSTNHFSVYGVGYKTPMAYTDIGTHWAKTDIEFVVDRGLMSGTSAATFAPDDTMTRGMFATALGRLAGADVSSYKQSSFSDVNADSYYLGYIEWANKYGIMTSASEGKFAPDSPVTREQMAVVMEQYTTVLGFKLPTVHVANTFADNAKISSMAAPSVKRVQMAGIITGKTNNVFDPQGTATRAEVSAVFKRFVELAIFSDTAQGFKMNDSGKWMYYENGKAVTGTKTIGGTTYNFNSYGETSDVPNN